MRQGFIESLSKNGSVDDYMKLAIKDDELELEWIHGLPDGSISLSKEVFLRLKHALHTSSGYTTLDEENTLDIRTELISKNRRSFSSTVRATLTGVQEIRQYCIQDNFDDLNPIFINKLMYKNPKNPDKKYTSIKSGVYPCRLNLKQETQLNYLGTTVYETEQGEQTVGGAGSKEVMVFLKNWTNKNKSFRYKKRYSFLTLDNLWRIDLTAIKQSKQNTYHKTFKDSKLLQQNEHFELEIEFVGSNNVGMSSPLETFLINRGECDTYQDTPSGSVFQTDLSFTNGDEMYDMYVNESSPRYDAGIEFDEPVNYVSDSPRPLPDVVHIKNIEEWSEDKGKKFVEEIQKQQSKGIQYKFIPRNILKVEKKLEVSVVPSLPFTNDVDVEVEIDTLYIPLEYIVEDIVSPEELTEPDSYEGYTPDSPRDSSEGYTPASPRGGSKLKGTGSKLKRTGSKLKGGGNNMFIDSSMYSANAISKVLGVLEQAIDFCYTIIYDTPHYLDLSQEKDILRDYSKFTNSGKYWKFVGPQPVSMSKEELNPLNPHSILGGYVVTEKADGIRAQLFIKDNQGYLITPKKKVIDTGLTFSTPNQWLFDGEYITEDKQGNPIKLYMIFDVYYCDKYPTQPYTLPWLSKKGLSRSKALLEFKQECNIESIESELPNLRIGYKEYLEGPEKLTKKKGLDKYSNLMGIFKSAKKILDKQHDFEYSTDGLIFLPMFLPVKGSEEGDIVKSISGTWTNNYKWKPPEENTIDFKVVFSKDKSKDVIHSYNEVNERGEKTLTYYQKVELVVDYQEKDDSSIDFNWALLTNQPINKKPFVHFDPPTHKRDNIHLTNIQLTNKTMRCLKDNQDIRNGDIVEMRYQPENKNGFLWVPLRVRSDKTKPQYFTIANNIWSTINDPVSTEMIRGNLDIDEIVEELSEKPVSDKYYVDTRFSEDTPIRDLHNYIKSKLISRIGSSNDFKRLMIADLSCGRGGDIKKYLSIKNKVEFILGLDISGNINEAAQRYHYMNPPKPKALFLQFDTSKSIERTEGCVSQDTDKNEIGSTMLNMIFKRSSSYPKKYTRVHKNYAGIAKDKFEIVSSQFSLHYYFKDEITLRGFCENLSYLCAKGGYFIGTCYDGMKLFKTMEQLQTDTLEMTDSFGSLIYQIQKKYTTTDFTYNKERPQDMYGNEISVFMSSIGQHITEYLVNFEFFVDIMDEYGFSLDIPSFKQGDYNPIKDPIQSFDQIIDNLDEVREKDNNFVKRTKNTELFKVGNNKEYKLLSGLNNWFIFKKR